MPVEIEDFTCNANPLMPKLICYAVTIVATILALFVPVLAIPAVVAAVLSAAIYIRVDDRALSAFHERRKSERCREIRAGERF